MTPDRVHERRRLTCSHLSCGTVQDIGDLSLLATKLSN